MTPDQAVAELQRRAERLRQAADGVQVPALTAAREVAGLVKLTAARNGHGINIRVVETGNAVRLTITGRAANHYRQVVRTELEKRAPAIRAEIRTLLTRRAR
jgi:hypothetical protein